MILAMNSFLMVVLSIIAFIFVIGIIIIVHELGHFIVAKKAGILCHEFSIGMGPAIYKKQGKETLFCIRAIPIGGYVSMASESLNDLLLQVGDNVYLTIEDDVVTKISLEPNSVCDISGELVEKDLFGESGNGLYLTIRTQEQETLTYAIKEEAIVEASKKEQLRLSPYKRSVESKSIPKRLLTFAAGALMNFALAIVIYLIYFCATGVPNYSSNEIGSLLSGYNASSVLQAGDKIVAVEGTRVNSWYEFEEVIDNETSKYKDTVNVTVDRNGTLFEEEIAYTIIINSIGISNIDVSEYDYPEGLDYGAIVGNVNPIYKNQNATGPYLLQPGDIITKMEVAPYIDKNTVGEATVYDINSWDDIMIVLKDCDVASVKFEYYSNTKASQTDDPYVHLSEAEEIQSYGNELLNSQNVNKIDFKIGVSPTYHFSLGGVITSAFKGFWSDFTLVFRTLKLLVAPSGIRQVGISDMSSVVGIFGMIQQIITYGFLPLLAFTAMLSVNIGIMNLLPIPLLDGGKIVMLGYEAITGKRPNKTFEAVLNNIFLLLLLALFFYVTFNDIMRQLFVFI